MNCFALFVAGSEVDGEDDGDDDGLEFDEDDDDEEEENGVGDVSLSAVNFVNVLILGFDLII